MFQAVHDNDPDPKLLAYQYLQTLPQIAQGSGSTFWVIPSEVTTALRSAANAFGGGTDTGPAEPSRAPRDQARRKPPTVTAAPDVPAIGAASADSGTAPENGATLENGAVPEATDAPGTSVSPLSAAAADAVAAMLADNGSGVGYFDPLGAADPVGGADAGVLGDEDPAEAAAATAPDRDLPSANGSEAAI